MLSLFTAGVSALTAAAADVLAGRVPGSDRAPNESTPRDRFIRADRGPRRLLSDGGGAPKLVFAYVRPDRLDDVKDALAEAGAPSLTVMDVSGRGSQPAKTGQWRGEEYTVDLHQKVKVECVVADVPPEDVAQAIADAARTGEPGDGKVFVSPIESAHQIRTGKRGPDAV